MNNSANCIFIALLIYLYVVVKELAEITGKNLRLSQCIRKNYVLSIKW